MLLYRYIVKEHIFPFLASLSIIIFLFIMQQAIMMLDRIVSKNIDPLVVLEVFLIQLGWILALGIPMAMLCAALMTFGRMAGDNEITAIKASGRSMAELILPVMSAAAVVTVALFYFHDLILPESNHHAAKLLGDISRKRPAAFIEPGVLIRDFPNYTLYVEEVNAMSGALTGVRILTDEADSDPSITVAKSGNIRMTTDGEYLELTLYNGETHSTSHKNDKEYVLLRFQKQVIYIKNVDSRFERSESSARGNRELNINTMADEVRDIKRRNTALDAQRRTAADSAATILAHAGVDTNAYNAGNLPNSDGLPRRLQNRLKSLESEQYRLSTNMQNNDLRIAQLMVEIHKKFAIPVACLIFVLIGAPLGIMARRGGMAVGASYSVFFFIIYWACLIVGENWGSKLIVSPIVGMWSGNVFLAICGLVLMMLMLRETTISFAFITNFFKKKRAAALKRSIQKPSAFSESVQAILRVPKVVQNKINGTLPTYLLNSFLNYALGLLAAILVIYVTIDYVSNLRRFENATWQQVILYYYYYLPWIAQAVLPIVLFLSSMFSMGNLAKKSELTAMKAAGINIRQLTKPLLIFGLLLSGAVFYVGELIIPHANEQRAITQNNFGKTGDEQAQQRSVREYRRNFFYFATPDIMYVFNEFCTEPQFFRGVRRYNFKPDGIIERIDAMEAEYMGAADMGYYNASWRFAHGHKRTFDEEGMKTEFFRSLPDSVLLTAAPLDLAKRVRSPMAMSYWELASHIDAAKRRGERVHRFMAELQFKIALPFMNFIVILFGLALAALSGRKGGAALLGVGMLLAFMYWILTRFALVFAQNGYIPIMVGAWCGNVLFFIIGTILYRKAAY